MSDGPRLTHLRLNCTPVHIKTLSTIIGAFPLQELSLEKAELHLLPRQSKADRLGPTCCCPRPRAARISDLPIRFPTTLVSLSLASTDVTTGILHQILLPLKSLRHLDVSNCYEISLSKLLEKEPKISKKLDLVSLQAWRVSIESNGMAFTFISHLANIKKLFFRREMHRALRLE